MIYMGGFKCSCNVNVPRINVIHRFKKNQEMAMNENILQELSLANLLLLHEGIGQEVVVLTWVQTSDPCAPDTVSF